MNIAFIHNNKKLHTGANYINDLIAQALRGQGVAVNEFYPKRELLEHPNNLKGLANILFFYSLLENKRKILRNDIIQGTTYTPITFLAFNKPVISHFGSTTYGFLQSTPRAHCINNSTKNIIYTLHKDGVIPELNIRTKRPLRDVAEIEQYVAQRATKVIATSNFVREELITQHVNPDNITVIHNAIENFWFDTHLLVSPTPHLVFIGRLGNDSFMWKLKGIDRLIGIYKKYPSIPKLSFIMTVNNKLEPWLQKNIRNHVGYYNVLKPTIKEKLQNLYGSIFLLTSRYEGFSLSLIEAMSQGLVPVVYSVGVVPEIIVNGKNGYIVHNHKEMIQRIDEILNDKKKRLFMAENSKKTASRFQVHTLVQVLITLYASIV